MYKSKNSLIAILGFLLIAVIAAVMPHSKVSLNSPKETARPGLIATSHLAMRWRAVVPHSMTEI